MFASFFFHPNTEKISDLFLIDRMPPQMGDLISEAVYESLLRSFSGHIIKKSTIATHFVDIPSKERWKDDSYWVSCLIGCIFLYLLILLFF